MNRSKTNLHERTAHKIKISQSRCGWLDRKRLAERRAKLAVLLEPVRIEPSAFLLQEKLAPPCQRS
jgi:hypothetical protein